MTVQVGHDPEQPPVQVVTVPAGALAVSVMMLPASNVAEQVGVHLMPEGNDVTVPVLAPVSETMRVTVLVGGVVPGDGLSC